MKTFNFYLADEDATTGWSNHTFTLQFVAQGKGSSIGEAWLDAQHKRPDELGIPDSFGADGDSLTVIEEQNELTFIDRRPRQQLV